MIKIMFSNKKTVKRVRKILTILLSKKCSSETIHNTIWYNGLCLIISSYTIKIDVFNNDFITDEEMKDILKESLKKECSYILCYNGLQFYIDNLNANEKVLEVL